MEYALRWQAGSTIVREISGSTGITANPDGAFETTAHPLDAASIEVTRRQEATDWLAFF
jgi:hypothetical protein